MIKLRELINLTEQAPQPMKGAPPSPVPEPEPVGAPPADTAPTPEDPSEYDWTRDFRAFEDTKNKQEAAAKKGLVNKMNKFLLNKTITANASRGYGQPKSDYTIENIKKVSVEFWYDKYVVIVSDSNDKKYFLTPGVNLKIDQGAAGGEQPAQPGADQAPVEPPPEQTPPEPEVPAEPKAEEPPAESPPEGGLPAEPKAAMEPPPAAPKTPAPKAPAPSPAPKAPTPTAPKVPAPKAPEPEVPAPAPKKKRVLPQPVAEDAPTESSRPLKADDIRDVANVFYDFLPDDVKDKMGRRFDVTKYFKQGTSSGGGEGWNSEYTIEIPEEIFGGNLDIREFKLHAQDYMRSSGGPGQPFSRGYVDIQKHGRFYVFTFSESGGLDI
jgi:hypothetical protein